MAEGEFALVQDHLERAIHKGSIGWRPRGDHDVYVTLADAAARRRDAEALRRYAPLAEEAATRYGHRLYQAIVHRAWGVAHHLAGEHAEAEARLRQGLELFKELDTGWQLGRTYLELGELALSRGDMGAARKHLGEALALFRRLGAAADAEQAERALESKVSLKYEG